MQLTDLEAVLRIEKENFSAPYGEAQYAYEIEDNPCAYLYVIEVDGNIVGYVDYWITFDSCQLCKIAIDQKYQHHGYGEQLMKFMFLEAETMECEAVLLEVRVSNGKAQSFYERLGFLEIHRRKDYYVNPKEDGIIFGKVLVGK